MIPQNENFGIMDEGYFVPRSEILTWVNDLLKINLTKIEELGSGAVYCQIVDVVNPGKVALSKVNWKAKVDYEFLNNYKILQNAFDKVGIKSNMQVERLSKAKYQDNLQFIQWLKRYYEVNCNDKSVDYNAEQRRGTTKIDFSFAEKIVVPKSFNAGGQVIPKPRVGSKQKRSDIGSSGQKQSAKRLVSPQNLQKLNSGSQEKKQVQLQRKDSSKELKKISQAQVQPVQPVQPVQTHKPPNPHKSTKFQHKSQPIEQTSIRPSRGSYQQLEKYKKMVRDLESKLEMIAQIAQTKDDAEIKMKLIEEILSINSSKLSKLSEFQGNKSSSMKQLQTIKTEEDIAEQIQMGESIPQHRISAFQGKKEVKKSSKISKSQRVKEEPSVKKEDEQQVF